MTIVRNVTQPLQSSVSNREYIGSAWNMDEQAFKKLGVAMANYQDELEGEVITSSGGSGAPYVSPASINLPNIDMTSMGQGANPSKILEAQQAMENVVQAANRGELTPTETSLKLQEQGAALVRSGAISINGLNSLYASVPGVNDFRKTANTDLITKSIESHNDQIVARDKERNKIYADVAKQFLPQDATQEQLVSFGNQMYKTYDSVANNGTMRKQLVSQFGEQSEVVKGFDSTLVKNVNSLSNMLATRIWDANTNVEENRRMMLVAEGLQNFLQSSGIDNLTIQSTIDQTLQPYKVYTERKAKGLTDAKAFDETKRAMAQSAIVKGLEASNPALATLSALSASNPRFAESFMLTKAGAELAETISSSIQDGVIDPNKYSESVHELGAFDAQKAQEFLRANINLANEASTPPDVKVAASNSALRETNTQIAQAPVSSENDSAVNKNASAYFKTIRSGLQADRYMNNGVNSPQMIQDAKTSSFNMVVSQLRQLSRQVEDARFVMNPNGTISAVDADSGEDIELSYRNRASVVRWLSRMVNTDEYITAKGVSVLSEVDDILTNELRMTSKDKKAFYENVLAEVPNAIMVSQKNTPVNIEDEEPIDTSWFAERTPDVTVSSERTPVNLEEDITYTKIPEQEVFSAEQVSKFDAVDEAEARLKGTEMGVEAYRRSRGVPEDLDTTGWTEEDYQAHVAETVGDKEFQKGVAKAGDGFEYSEVYFPDGGYTFSAPENIAFIMNNEGFEGKKSKGAKTIGYGILVNSHKKWLEEHGVKDTISNELAYKFIVDHLNNKINKRLEAGIKGFKDFPPVHKMLLQDIAYSYGENSIFKDSGLVKRDGLIDFIAKLKDPKSTREELLKALPAYFEKTVKDKDGKDVTIKSVWGPQRIKNVLIKLGVGAEEGKALMRQKCWDTQGLLWTLNHKLDRKLRRQKEALAAK